MAPPTDPAQLAEVSAANAAFYDAFEQRDLDAMSDVWEHSERATCVHPGWGFLRGWGAVSASWFAIFDGPQRLQFIVTDEHVDVVGDVAWVSCSENLIDDGDAQTVAAVNVFVRDGEGWSLVHHHGSPIAIRPAPQDS